VGDVFKAIADPTRRLTLFELCTRLIMKHEVGSSRQAISQHLDVLEEAGLVHTRRDGRYKFHFIDTTPIREITARWHSHGRREDR
jgi:DNA-binding transcriptional ArsR family regulator